MLCVIVQSYCILQHCINVSPQIDTLRWCLYFSWIFWKFIHIDKNDKLVFCGKFPPGFNALSITLCCELSNALPRHSILMLRSMNKRTQPFMAKSCSASCKLVLKYICCCYFSYHELPVKFKHYMRISWHFMSARGICRYLLLVKIIVW